MSDNGNDAARSAPFAKALLSVNEVCAYLGMSRATFYRMRNDPQAGFAEILVAIPPGSGRLKVPLSALSRIGSRPTPVRP